MKFGLPLAAIYFCTVASFSFGQSVPTDENVQSEEANAATVVTTDAISEEEAYAAWAASTWESLNRQTGVITLANSGATLNVPESFYYLDPKDSETVLSEIWGNPPGQSVLGMLMPANTTPFDADSWAVTVEYQQDGYVSDDDAHKLDYDDLLKDMKAGVAEASKERLAMGYEAIRLVGWAAEPYYDAQAHKLHWAKELEFGGDPNHTLNYDIRVLGRRGVLVLSFIAGIDQKTMIEENLDTVLAMAEFDDGARYSDFNPDIDEVAAYGIGALVAGKLAAKTGLLAIVLVFLKKFGVFILIALGGLAKMLFTRKKS